MEDAGEGAPEQAGRNMLFVKYFFSIFFKFIAIVSNCEAQGKGRAKGRPRKVTQRSL